LIKPCHHDARLYLVNGAASFTLTGKAIENPGWGVGPYDVYLRSTGVEPLMDPMGDQDLLHLDWTLLPPPPPPPPPPPAPTCGLTPWTKEDVVTEPVVEPVRRRGLACGGEAARAHRHGAGRGLGGTPQVVAVVPGRDVAIDSCCEGQAWVRIVRTYPVLPGEFPNGRGSALDEGADPGVFWAVEMGAGTARCAPSPDDAGIPPTAAQLERSASELADDAGRVRRTVLCELQKLPTVESVWIGEQSSVGPSGGCVGQEVLVAGDDEHLRVRGVRPMRKGQKVTVKALTAMPGVEDGAVLHVEWGPRLAKLVEAGRYQVLEGEEAEQAATAAAEPADGNAPTPAPTTAADGDGESRARRARSR
jgi:hypothetical protein